MTLGHLSRILKIFQRIGPALLCWLAVIVQIIAPGGATAAVVRATFDPFARLVICGPDHHSGASRDRPEAPPALHGDPCGLCQLVAAGGFAPPSVAPALPCPHPPGRVAARPRLAPLARRRRLDWIRARAPPAPV
ncbi:DUF2946 family protein [Methylobacterium sp. WSM2598]|uniref:DUF2946 family protein n=1 Tax=Methylobacterium sp. WSM2598 TaxID=398261 RepID=UPI0004758B06|nr:DUF2946 family protein [Methylobacterium sp. WSM2598]